MVLPNPAGGKRDQREPEEQVQIRPQHPAVDAMDQVEEVVMIVPVYGNVNETQLDFGHFRIDLR